MVEHVVSPDIWAKKYPVTYRANEVKAESKAIRLGRSALRHYVEHALDFRLCKPFSISICDTITII